MAGDKIYLPAILTGEHDSQSIRIDSWAETRTEVPSATTSGRNDPNEVNRLLELKFGLGRVSELQITLSFDVFDSEASAANLLQQFRWRKGLQC